MSAEDQVKRADLDKAPADVAGMFDTVAPRYDLMNDVLSLGQVRLWRKATREALELRPGQLVLDIGAGTGTSSVDLARSGARVVGADFSLGMLRQGRKQYPDQPLVAADAMRLPFPDDTFDAVTMSYALRNVADTQVALREFARVTKPGGRVVVAEFSTPANPAFRTLYSGYLMQYLPRVAGRLGSNGPSYQYLAESIRDWPAQAQLAKTFQRAGWRRVAWRNLTGGIVAVHRGFLD